MKIDAPRSEYLFPTQIALGEIKDFSTFQQDLIDWIYEYERKDHGTMISNRGGYQSESKEIFTERSFRLGILGNYIDKKIYGSIVGNIVNYIKKNKITSKIHVGKSPAGIYLTNSNKLFVAIKGEDIITIIDTVSLQKIKDVKVGKAPYGVFSKEDTNLLFVTNVQSNSVTIIDKNSLKALTNIDVGQWPYQIAYENKRKLIFVTNQRDNSISIIDLKKLKVSKTLDDVCEYPEGIDISYNENLIVVACWFEDNIILLNLESYKLVKKIEVSGGPRSFGNFILEDYE